jgi:hypothetical protein
MLFFGDCLLAENDAFERRFTRRREKLQDVRKTDLQQTLKRIEMTLTSSDAEF